MRFNAVGVDNHGIRDLARELDLSPGNVTYWFPRKEDLVRGLLDALRDANDARPAASGGVATLNDLLHSVRASLLTQLEYRCLTESIVHVVKTWPALLPRYQEVDRARRAGLAAAVRSLREAGELTGPTDDAGLARLVATWTLIARFWLAERGISYPEVDDARAVDHYVALVAASLVPHAARPADLQPWLGGVRIDASLGRG